MFVLTKTALLFNSIISTTLGFLGDLSRVSPGEYNKAFAWMF